MTTAQKTAIVIELACDGDAKAAYQALQIRVRTIKALKDTFCQCSLGEARIDAAALLQDTIELFLPDMDPGQFTTEPDREAANLITETYGFLVGAYFALEPIIERASALHAPEDAAQYAVSECIEAAWERVERLGKHVRSGAV